MKRDIIITSDGSTTIHLPELNEQYHSKHGAIEEAKHVYIKNGFNIINNDEISILEVGFGTGLNCFITFLESKKKIYYTAIEAYPVFNHEIKKLNYIKELEVLDKENIFNKLHSCKWNKQCKISKNFSLTKLKLLFQNISFNNEFNLIYYDAFGARVQPELWTEEIFIKMYNSLKSNGVLVTYSAKGSVRRALQNVGFYVERLKGPPGKREMLRAIKK